jgi:molecular chaperone Hsp33
MQSNGGNEDGRGSNGRVDRLIQGMAASGDFRIVAAETTAAAEVARGIFDLSPVAADAFGRALTGAVLLARLLDKGFRGQYVTLRFEGDGPLGLMVTEANIGGAVRGYVSNPQVEERSVGAAVGSNGLLTVVRGTPPEGKPYTSQVRLVSGEVARDLAHYLLASEQIPSAVLLGVLNRPAGVAAAGGVVVQAFPHATADEIARMEKCITDAPPLSTLLARMSIDEAVAEIFRDVGYKAIDSSFDVPIEYRCSCTRERALAQFNYFSPQELGEMIRQEEESVATCQFCGRSYAFTPEDLLGISRASDA